MRIYKYKIVYFSILLLIRSYEFASGQPEKVLRKNGTEVQQKDIVDLYQKVFNKKSRKDTSTLKGNGPFISVIPAIGYSMHTGITGVVATSTIFYTDDERKRNSRVVLNGYYSQYHQYWFTTFSNIFFEKQKFNLVGDTRFYKFPTQTYGLGTKSPISIPLQIDYSYLRFYQVAFREIATSLFIGIGYNLDYHWNIKVDSVNRNEFDQFTRYQQGSHSVSSGISLNFMYDSRKNVVNPRNGTYANVQFRPNMTLLGSDRNWQSLMIDIRHYIKLPASSHNILALWSYDEITISGAPPYLDLPSIGWDDYSSTGRGYSPGRYTGRNLVYLESEYRFALTKNGLLGGVIFVNAESVFERDPDIMQSFIPAGGFGLRIKISKYSDTNLAIDYGFGIRGSRGFFFNMGEFF